MRQDVDWEPFEPAGLFGQEHGAPAVVARGAFATLDMQQLLGVLRPQQEHAYMGGQRVRVPRMEAWWGPRAYAFGGRVLYPRPRTPEVLAAVGSRVAVMTGERFDACFVNYYRDEHDHIPWHADDDAWIGPVVASLSLGATRRFWLRKKRDHSAVVRGELHHGDLLVMQAGCQQEWEHRIPKEGSPRGPRLNLTFRQSAKERT